MNRLLIIPELAIDLERALYGERDANHYSALMDIPWLELPVGYSFKPIFPFGGAAARVLVCKTTDPRNMVSVYLDTQNILGWFNDAGDPYWEAYPIGGDTARFAMDDTKELVNAIIGELEKRALA